MCVYCSSIHLSIHLFSRPLSQVTPQTPTAGLILKKQNKTMDDASSYRVPAVAELHQLTQGA